MLRIDETLFRSNNPTRYLRSNFSIASESATIRGIDDNKKDYVKTVQFMKDSKENKVYMDISLIKMLAESELKHDARMVLFYILKNIKHGYNYITLIGTDIVKETGITASDASKGISELKRKDIIVKAKDLDMYKDDKNITSKIYILNHNYAIKGKFDKLKTEVEQQESTLKRKAKFLPKERIMY